MIVYSSGSLETVGYTNLDFQGDIDSRKSTSGYVFTFNGGAIVSNIASEENLADPLQRVCQNVCSRGMLTLWVLGESHTCSRASGRLLELCS